MPFEIASSFKKLCIKLFHMLDAFQLSSFIFFPFYFKNLCLQRNQSWTKPLRKDANYHGPWKQQLEERFESMMFENWTFFQKFCYHVSSCSIYSILSERLFSSGFNSKILVSGYCKMYCKKMEKRE